MPKGLRRGAKARQGRLPVLCLALALSLLGCKSRPWGSCVSPGVRGRVLAADTGRPLEGVLVTRGEAGKRPASGVSPKGSELLLRPAPIRTDAEGRFALHSERVLTIIPVPGWNSVRLSFERSGYRRFQTNISFTAPGLTNAPGTPDLVPAGDILLSPLKK